MTLIFAGGRKFSGQEYLDSPASLQDALKVARAENGFAQCLCTEPTPRRLVIREVRGVLYLAVWPHDGTAHASHCQFYRSDSDAENTSDYQGSTQKPLQLGSEGEWNVNLDLPRFATNLQRDSTDSGVSKGAMPLAQFLSWIWDATNMCRWVKGWRRDWWSVRRTVIAEAQSVKISGAPLDSCLYIPPPFRKDQEREIHAEYADFLHGLGFGSGQFGLVLCEVRSLGPSKFGYTLHVKNLAKPLFLGESVYKFLAKQHALPLALIKDQKDRGCCVVALLAVEVTSKGNVNVVDAALSLMSKSYIPVATVPELQLANKLVDESRTFVRGVGKQVGADFVLRDCVPNAALMIYSLATREYTKHRDEVAKKCRDAGCQLWSWHSYSGQPVPALPRSEPN